MANYKAVAARWARHYGIPPKLFATLVQWESGWNNGAVSPRGAKGFTQLEPGTAQGLGVDPSNPGQNLQGGARYLREQYDAFKGLAARIHVDPWALALAAYNAGPNAVESHGGIPPYKETEQYVHGILSAAGHLDAVATLAPKTPALPPAPKLEAPQPVAPAAPALPQPPDLTGFALDNLSHLAAHTYTPAGSLGALTEAVSAQQHQPAPAPVTPTVAPSPAAASPTGPHAPKQPAALHGFTLPVKGGKVIGGPYQGTHAKAFNEAGGSDNWESENAYDIAVPVGTPIFAVRDGVIGPQFGSLGSGGRFAGLRLHLVAGGGLEYYYAHLSRFAHGIEPGTHVHVGEIIGYSGEANGVAHLHIAVNHGKPPR